MKPNRTAEEFRQAVCDLQRSGPRSAPVSGEHAADILFGLYLAARQGPDIPEALDLADRTDGVLAAAARALDRTAELLSADPVLVGSSRVDVRDLAARSLRQQAEAALFGACPPRASDAGDNPP